MPASTVDIRPFDLKGASDHEYAALNRHGNTARAEILPDDPPSPLEVTIAEVQNIPPVFMAQAWSAWSADGAEIIGSAHVGYLDAPENRHLVQFDVHVLPEYRRQGIGRELLRRVAEVPRREGRRLMMTNTSERVPAGEAFMVRLGAEKGSQTHTNQLVLADVDREQIRRWQKPDGECAAGFELGFWEGPYPDAQMDEVVALYGMMNTAPRDNLDMEDVHFTADHLRQMEAQMLAGGTERWTFYVRETASGRFGGYTEGYWSPHRPRIVNQGATGVSPEFRGCGLGRRLKAAMLDKILRERPEAAFVRTGNADSNAAMLRINHELGFQPYISRCDWQVETEKVLAYLENPARPFGAGEISGHPISGHP